MQVGMIGLGRMGQGMARRLVRGGHEVVAYNRSPHKARELAAGESGGQCRRHSGRAGPAAQAPRVLWLMLPADAVDANLAALAAALAPGDLVVEGGNSHFRDDPRRAAMLAAGGIEYLDAGVSGGVWELTESYCLMVGGSRPRP